MACGFYGWAEEYKIAFVKVTEIKTEVETLFNKFEENRNKLSAAEINVLDEYRTKFQDTYVKRPIGVMPGYDDCATFQSLSNGYEHFLEKLNTPRNLQLEREYFEATGETSQEREVIRRKRFIKSCARFVKEVTELKDEFLAAISAVQVERPAIAAAAATTTKTGTGTTIGKQSKQKTITTTLYQRVKAVVVNAYNTVKATVLRVVNTVKTTIKNSVAMVQTKIAAILA